MGKKFILSIIFTVSTLLLFYSSTIFAEQSTSSVKRLSGVDRYETSSAIALSGWSQSDYAILTYGENFPDALSAAPLAKKYNAPILLTETNSVPAETLNVINQLKVKNIMIVGGTGVISPAVEKQITSLGIAVTRICGQDRYETDIKVAEQLDNVSEIAIVTGESFPDALSISPIAAKKNMPIILIPHNSIPSVVTNYINSHKLTKTYFIGSGKSLNNAVLTGLSNIELITGDNEYQINLNIIDKFKTDLDFNTIYIASGENFPDGLSGSILAGKNSNPMLLAGNDISLEKNYFTNNSIAINNIVVLGGTGAVTDGVISKFKDTATSALHKVQFISTSLTKTGANTATFQYRVVDENATNITNTVLSSEISAVASIDSSISLDPITGIGTITFKSYSDIDKPIIITLIDQLSGIEAVLNTGNSTTEPTTPTNNYNTSVAEIDILSTNLIRQTPNTGTFKYKIFDKAGKDITAATPASEITANSWIGSSSGAVKLDPLTGIGTVTYKFATTDRSITIQLVDYNGLVGMSTLSLNGGQVEESDIYHITLGSTMLTKTVTNTATFEYQLANQFNMNITSKIPASQILASASVSSTITLDPSTGIGTIKYYSSSDADKPIIITLIDKFTGVTGSSTLYVDESESKKVGKITMNSTKLSIAPQGNGYATYSVYDQYGNDITSTTPASNVTFKSQVGTIFAKYGLLTVIPNAGVDLSKITSVEITGSDSITGVSITVTLGIFVSGQ